MRKICHAHMRKVIGVMEARAYLLLERAHRLRAFLARDDGDSDTEIRCHSLAASYKEQAGTANESTSSYNNKELTQREEELCS